MTKPSAKEAIIMVAGLALRKRRKTRISDSTDKAGADGEDQRNQHDRRQVADEDDGRGVDRRPEHGEDAEGDVVAMGEIDEPHDAEDRARCPARPGHRGCRG